MMRPMKLTGEYIIFGEGALDYLKTIKGQKAMIVISGGSIEKSGYLQMVIDNLKDAGIESRIFRGVEPDPSFETVRKGADAMLAYGPDWIIGIGGGSAMDASKAMWVFYEHPQLKTLEEIASPNVIPALRNKAKLICIPSTSGTASEVSRSIVISDTHKGIKVGIGSMEMFPDVALLEPGVTASMPPTITAATGIDALTHALEAYVSTRANDISDALAEKAITGIFKYLPLAYDEGSNLLFREKMQNYSAIAGMAFTNVSLGIVHSMAHVIGGKFGISHGLANGILLPYVVAYNSVEPYAAERYGEIAGMMGKADILEAIQELERSLGIPTSLKEVIHNKEEFMENLMDLADTAKADGCTKTNPRIPTTAELVELFRNTYDGKLVKP